MSNSTELASLDGLGLAALVERKEVKPLDLVEAAIDRISRLNPKINAVIYPLFDEARALARNEAALPQGAFRGVPYLIKDLVSAYAGAPMTSGSAFLRNYRPSYDSVLISRLKRAGLIIVGKTNIPELGLLPTTEPRLFGPTRNPWNLDRTAGGSSGGSSAAVAARMVPMAHANDGGGSIRMPASCCGVFGLKPTRGRISLGPAIGDAMGGLVVEHAVTLSVRDSAALLDATAGPSAGDPYWAQPPVRPFSQEVGSDPGQLLIALSKSPVIKTPVHADCIRAVEDAVALCRGLGHEVTEDSPKLNGDFLIQMFMTVWAAGAAASIDGAAAVTGKAPDESGFEPGTWALYQIGRGISASDYLRALDALQSISRTVAQFMERYDVWLTPTLGSPPMPLGWLSAPPLDALEAQQRTIAFAAFTPLSNVTGQPAMSVPLYWNKEGLPIGTHFAGRYGDEATLFRLAAQLEAARPWIRRIPPIAALG
ncbi:MAG TPA: amidase [Terriglobia bacterium]|nr:amidase [Terriglobia bacterium]